MSDPQDDPNRSPSRRLFIRRAIGGGLGVSAGLASGAAALPAQTGSPISAFDHVAVPMRNTDAMISFYRALGFTVMEGPNICSVHFGDNKINLHRPEFWQSGTFTLRAPPPSRPAETSVSCGMERSTPCARLWSASGWRSSRVRCHGRVVGMAAPRPARVTTFAIRTTTCSNSSSTDRPVLRGQRNQCRQDDDRCLQQVGSPCGWHGHRPPTHRVAPQAAVGQP